MRTTARALVHLGHRATVICASDRRAQWDDGGARILTVPAPPGRERLWRGLRAFPMGECIAQRLAATRLAAEARHIHRTDPFTVIQTASFRAVGLLLTGRADPPAVCRVSSLSPLCRAAYGAPSRPGHRLTDRMERRAIATAAAAFAPSRLIADRAAAATGRAVALLRTPLREPDAGPDPSFFREHLAGFPYLLFVGTLSRIKGADLFAEALPAVFPRHPALRMVFIGRDDGMPDGRPVFDLVRERCAAWAPRLLHFAPIPHRALDPAIQAAEACVFPSRVDNHPNACLDAIRLGTPAIGTRDSSLDEMIQDGVTGFLIRNGDAAALADAINRLLALPPDCRAALRERTLALACEMRAEDRIGRLVAFYKRVAAKDAA